MKKKDLYALACVLCFAECSSPASDDIEIVKNLFPVQFNLQLQKETLPFTRSIPSNTVPEPTLPGDENTDKGLEDLCSEIEYVVYDEEDLSVPVRYIQYNIHEEDFGIVYDTLPAGKYQICFLAHQSETTNLAEGIMSFDKLSDTFYTTQSITLDKGQENNADIILQRIVSRIEFKATDPVPEALERFDISISNYPDRINILNGKSLIATESYQLTHLFTPEEKKQIGMIHSFYTFIPPENEKLSVVLTATDAEQNVLRTRTITDIIPQINKIVRYSGILFTPPKPDDAENTFQLSIGNQGKWEDTEEIELTD